MMFLAKVKGLFDAILDGIFMMKEYRRTGKF